MNAPLSIPSEDGFRPDRLWSLCDMARPFNLWLFLHARGFLKDAARLESEAGYLQRMVKLTPSMPKTEADISADDEIQGNERELSRRTWQAIRNDCVELELVGSVASIGRMLAHLDAPHSKYGRYWAIGKELDGRLVDELENRHFLSLSLKETEYYREPQKGWELAIKRFPETMGDIEEARKCFALSRYAASVFHSLQVVEFGIIALGRAIGSSDPLEGWASTTNKLQAIIKKKYEDRTPFEREHFADLEQLHGTIEALKNAWRNKVSHVHGKLVVMTSDFSPDVADDILSATRAFMRRLASDGPLASQEQPS